MVSHLQRRTLVLEPCTISVNGQKGQPSGYQQCPKGKTKDLASYCFSAVWLHRVRSIKSKHSLFINPTVDFSGKSLKPCGRPRTILAQSLYSPNTMSDRKFESLEIGVRYRPTIGAPKDS